MFMSTYSHRQTLARNWLFNTYIHFDDEELNQEYECV